MTRIKGYNLTILGCITDIEVVRAYGKALKTDTEDLALQTILDIVILCCKDLVERLLKVCAVLEFVYCGILATVVYPDVEN